MTTPELLTALTHAGITLTLTGQGQVSYRAPKPRFKGVWYAATNFALILLSDTS
jgi:hypothetical protein